MDRYHYAIQYSWCIINEENKSYEGLYYMNIELLNINNINIGDYNLLWKNNLKRAALHITNGNSFTALRRFGLRKTAVGLKSFMQFCLRHIWGRRHLLRKVL